MLAARCTGTCVRSIPFLGVWREKLVGISSRALGDRGHIGYGFDRRSVVRVVELPEARSMEFIRTVSLSSSHLTPMLHVRAVRPRCAYLVDVGSALGRH